MSDNAEELRSPALTPAWSIGFVLIAFISASLMVERSIHFLCNWLKKTDRKPLLAAVEKMKEELMLLGFVSLLLTVTSSFISNICIPTKNYENVFTPCTKFEVDKERENNNMKERKLLMAFIYPRLDRRLLNRLNQNTCGENYEPFVSYEGLEELHRFIFVMAVTHISYSCLTMLLAVVKIHGWRVWEDETCMDRDNSLRAISIELTMQRQSTFVKVHPSNTMNRNSFLVWVVRLVSSDNLVVLWFVLITLHCVKDSLCYMIRSMEEEFQSIVGVSAPLWGFVVAFMLFNFNGSEFYFWVALIPVTLVLFVGAKLQHVMATLALESAGISGSFSGSKFKLRDELFWFNNPKFLLSLIHFILFQNSFELASFFWFWVHPLHTLLSCIHLFLWHFGYNSCFLKNRSIVYLRLIMGFAGQVLCSYSTLPLYALVTQMGTNYKAALLPHSIRETMHGWGKEARRRRKHAVFADNSTVRTDRSSVLSVDEDDDEWSLRSPRFASNRSVEIELQPPTVVIADHSSVFNETNSRLGMPLLRPSPVSSPLAPRILPQMEQRSSSLPRESQ
ncbi:MLO-like protein 11 isoform X2 [Primulina huaijiensis]|uniref:MLO-like protein 11 isoform X2 n=1 Tax=Primulina huaijiensis TaxID=1492673 RepID=UPI003CC7933C